MSLLLSPKLKGGAILGAAHSNGSEFIASQPGIIRTSAFRQAGIGARDLVALINTGRLIRLKTGFYIAAEQLEHLSDYQIVVQLLPDAIICFISAAALYGLTTVIPDVIHVAYPIVEKSRKPRITHQWTLFNTKHLSTNAGSRKSRQNMGILPMYDRERTVCDCFKRQNELGMDVVAEIIRSYMRRPEESAKVICHCRKTSRQETTHAICGGFAMNNAASIKARLRNLSRKRATNPMTMFKRTT